MNLIKKYFCNESNLTVKEVSYAKAAFIIDSSCSSSATNFAGGAYLTAFFAYLGMSESLSNLVFSFTTFSMLWGLLVPFLTRRIKFYKPHTYLGRVFSPFSAGFIFLLPVITGVNGFSVILAAVLFLLSNIITNLIAPTYNVWYMNAISADGQNPGPYLGFKSLASFSVMIVTMLLAAKLFKIYSGDRQLYFFIIVGTLTLVLALITAVALLPVKEAPMEKKEVSTSSLRDFIEMFRDKTFAPYLTGNTIFLGSVNLIAALVNILTVQRLGIGLDIVSYMTIFDFALRGSFSPVFGKLVLKISARKLLAFSYLFVAISHVFYAFMTTDNFIVLKILSSVFMGIGYAGTGVCSFKYMFEAMPPEKSTTYMAGSSALSGIVAYLASLITTFVLAVANRTSFKILGITFSEMQFLFIVSAAFTILAIIFLLKKPKNSMNNK